MIKANAIVTLEGTSAVTASPSSTDRLVRRHEERRRRTSNGPLSHLLPLSLSAVFLLLGLASHPILILGDGDGLDALMDKMSTDALLLASEVERAHSTRCSDKTLRECPEGSYDSCLSEYPSQSCPGGDVFAIPECGADGTACGGLFDLTVSSVEIPIGVQGGLGVDGNPVNDVVKETLCYSLQSEEYMVQKFESEWNYWRTNYGVDAPHSFFGSDESVFRIHPARQSEECGGYDNTRRPWYVAATSGPKDVVLILDTSGSMTQSGRLDLMKAAARRVVETLTVGDHVAAISFNTDAATLVGTRMMQATDENKGTLLRAIDRLTAGGSTNFMAAFDETFDILERSRVEEFTSSCHTAMLFLTDGKMTLPTTATADDVVDLIETRSNQSGIDPLVFLYSLGGDANEGDNAAVPKRIACSTGGMWSHVGDGGDLASAMANYYKLFALGLADGDNAGFVAWVDPYKFATGGIMGTTVSAPVYDRSVTPSILVGAVGIDFTMAAMDKALGVEAGSRETLQRLVARSTAMCPKLELTECVVQSLRIDAGGTEALCPGECTNFVGIRPTACGTEDDYPTNFWANSGNKDRTYKERVCCSVGETRIEGKLSLAEVRKHQCVANATGGSGGSPYVGGGGSTLAPIIISVLVVAAVVVALCTACACYCCVCNRREPKSPSNHVGSGGASRGDESGRVGDADVKNGPGPTNAGKNSLAYPPPPTAPVAGPRPVASAGNHGYSSNPAWNGGRAADGVSRSGGGGHVGGNIHERTDGGSALLSDLPPAIAPVAVPLPDSSGGNYGYSPGAA